MTTMNTEIYDALIDAKVSEKKARAAAQSVASSDQTATKADVRVVNTKITMLMWMTGICILMIGWMVLTQWQLPSAY